MSLTARWIALHLHSFALTGIPEHDALFESPTNTCPDNFVCFASRDDVGVSVVTPPFDLDRNEFLWESYYYYYYYCYYQYLVGFIFLSHSTIDSRINFCFPRPISFVLFWCDEYRQMTWIIITAIVVIMTFVRSFICSFVRSFIHLLIHSFVRSFICSFIRSFLRSFARSFVRSFTGAFTLVHPGRAGQIKVISGKLAGKSGGAVYNCVMFVLWLISMIGCCHYHHCAIAMIRCDDRLIITITIIIIITFNINWLIIIIKIN